MLFDGLREIVVLDSHILRGQAISTLLAEQAKELGLGATWTDHIPEDENGNLVFAESTAACLYVIGGRTLAEPDVKITLKRCLSALAGRPLVVLVDEIDSESIEIAIAHEVRAVIPTSLPCEFALAAIRFIQAGGHYFPHSISIPAVTELWKPAEVAQNGEDSRPKPNENTFAHTLLQPGQGATEPCACQSLCDSACDEEHGIEIQIGEQTAHLTPRQIEVMQRIERGLSNKAIGRELNLSESTVKLHVRHLMRKLQVDNRTQIAVLALSADFSLKECTTSAPFGPKCS